MSTKQKPIGCISGFRLHRKNPEEVFQFFESIINRKKIIQKKENYEEQKKENYEEQKQI